MQDRMIRCPSCGQMNRISDDKVARGFQPICGHCKQPLTVSNAPVTVTDQNFSTLVERSEVPVLVDFWASWCGPCHMLAPVIEELAHEFSGRVRIAKLNTDENPQTSSRFQIRGIPALVLFANGREVDRLIGVQPKQQIVSRLQNILR